MVLTERLLIVNADDFGRSAGINRGVIHGHESGIVTSATLMVRWPDAEPAAAYARRKRLSLGLHLDLGEWVYRNGEWEAVYEVVAAESREAIEAEIAHQLDRFEQLAGQPPTHLDSHQHVHRDEPARSALRRAGDRLRVPVRDLTPGIAYSGAFFGQDGKGHHVPDAISVEALVETIRNLAPGITELGCHPAAESEDGSAYNRERVREVETLCDPRVRAAIHRAGVKLRSFSEL